MTSSEVGRRFSSLPREITDHIIDLARDGPYTLWACALVSRAWAPRARYHIFSSLHIGSTYQLHALHSILHIHPELKAFVRRLTIDNVPLQTVLASALATLPSLASLSLLHLSFDKSMVFPESRGNLRAFLTKIRHIEMKEVAWVSSRDVLSCMRPTGRSDVCVTDSIRFDGWVCGNRVLPSTGPDVMPTEEVYHQEAVEINISELEQALVRKRMSLFRLADRVGELYAETRTYWDSQERCELGHWFAGVDTEETEVDFERQSHVLLCTSFRSHIPPAIVQALRASQQDCGILIVHSSSINNSWLPFLLRSLTDANPKEIQLFYTPTKGGPTPDWPWADIDSVLADEAWTRLAALLVLVPHNYAVPPALPRFEERGGLIKMVAPAIPDFAAKLRNFVQLNP
jgi:hypothetical protein